VAGSPGGSAIINYVAKTLVGIIDWDLIRRQRSRCPTSAAATDRRNSSEIPRWPALEPKLRALGASVWVTEQTSGLQVIQRTRMAGSAGADPRREGVVRGD
jgi:gamma-glutamyltranspeptidase/glutathione hydrolase